MLKEITFYADFVKKRWCDNNKKTQNLRTFFFGTQKKKKTVKMREYVLLWILAFLCELGDVGAA